jgi:tRNA/tmRNA/rRNA uracil-C5-methylase (TrmA/RlmC/RlmD family)
MPALEPCPHRPPCPGCPRYGEPGPAPAALARLAALADAAGLPPPPIVAGARFGHRVRARLMVRGRASSPKLGIFQAGSHDLVDIPRCRVHHPLVNRVAAAARDAVRDTGTRPYAERRHAGALRALQIVVERESQSAQVVLVGNAAEPAPLAPLGAALAAALGPALHSLWWNGQPERSNAILGPHWHRWRGPLVVRERIGGADVFFPPGAFGQSHLELADAIVRRIHEQVPDGARVAELYAGCGPIGLGLLRRCARVALNEDAPDALRGLAMGIAARPPEEQARARVVPGAAGEVAAEFLAGADVAIADPPRKGLDAALRAALCATPPASLVYLSCDLGSFEADAAELLASRRWRLAALGAYDLFPNTEHVETLARFERV